MKTWSIAPVPAFRLWTLVALGALGALAGCARHRAQPRPGAAGAGDLALGKVGSGARASVSVAVVPPYAHERCRDGRVFIGEGGSPVTTMIDLPCFERGDCGPALARTHAGPGAASADGQIVRLQDYSILHARIGQQVKAGRAVAAAFLDRSTDCGDTWTAFTVDADALGGGVAGVWDRLSAYADLWDPRGLVYLAMDATLGGTRRTVLAWSNDFGNPSSWRAQPVLGGDLRGDARVAMAAPAGGRLYLLDVPGMSPRLTPIAVDAAAGTLSVLPAWYVFQSHGARAAAPDGAGWEDAATSGGGSLGLVATGRLADADHLIAVYQSGRAARVLEIAVGGTPAISLVKTTGLMTATSGSDGGSVADATLVEGPPGSLTAGVTWNDEEAATGRARTLWAGLAADPHTLAAARVLGPAPLSTDAAGAPRAWNRPGPPALAGRGAGYRGRGGFAGFLLPWIEGGATPELHVKAAALAMTAPWEIHVFDQQDDRWYTDGGDWAFLHFKADCSSSAVVVGLSVNRKTGGGHAITCHDHLIPMLAPASVAIDFFTGSKQRDTLPEWDAGYLKGECAADEAVTGVAQTTEGRFTRLRCTRMGGGFRRNVCFPHVVGGGDVDGGDNRAATTLDDWAKEADKGQCLTGQILKGVSKSARTGAVHAILCCYVSAM